MNDAAGWLCGCDCDIDMSEAGQLAKEGVRNQGAEIVNAGLVLRKIADDRLSRLDLLLGDKLLQLGAEILGFGAGSYAVFWLLT